MSLSSFLAAQVDNKNGGIRYSMLLTITLAAVICTFYRCWSKGPRRILSSAISWAFARYFVIDEKLVETNLLEGTKIVVRNVLLRRQVRTLRQNSLGFPTVITVTGSIEEVTFTWVWSFSFKKTDGGGDGWVRDATLTVKGVRVKAKLEHGVSEGAVQPALSTTREKETTSKPVPSNNDPKETEKKSGMKDYTRKQVEIVYKMIVNAAKSYVRKQMEMTIDSLMLHVFDVEFRVEIPPPRAETSGHNASSTAEKGTAIVVGGDTVEILSFGRREEVPSLSASSHEAQKDKKSNNVLKEQLTIGSFYAKVVTTTASNDGVFEAEIPLMNPFSYCTEVTRRSGKRFRNMGTGLDATGRSIRVQESGVPTVDCGLVLHAGKVQIQALTKLAAMLLASEEESSVVANMEKHDIVSKLFFPISSVYLVLLENTRISLSKVALTYWADGSAMGFEAEQFLLESTNKNDPTQAGSGVSVSGMKASMRPNLCLEMSVIETLYIPAVVRLKSPLCNTRIEFEGKGLSVKLESVDALMLSKSCETEEVGVGGATDSTPTTKTEASMTNNGTGARENKKRGSSMTGAFIPFPVNVSAQCVYIEKADGSNNATELHDVDLYVNPEESCPGSHVALCLGGFKNELLQLGKTNIYSFLPADRPDEIRGFHFVAESGVVTGGHSAEDWKEVFSLPEEVRRTKSKVLKFPYAKIAPLNIRIVFKGTGLNVKETPFVIKPFSGNTDTTSKDLVNFYAQACLSRVPEFLSNAEVLGFNLVDSTAFIVLGPALGPGGGLAAIAAVDVVKGAFAAGKRDRNVSEGDSWKPGDFVRGVVHSAEEMTEDGASRMGHDEGEEDVVDFAVGVSAATTNYVVQNKTRLLVGGAADAGMVGGFLVGGPIGAVAFGVVARRMTRMALESSEDGLSKEQVLETIPEEDPETSTREGNDERCTNNVDAFHRNLFQVQSLY